MQTATKKIYTILKDSTALATLLGGTATDTRIYPAIINADQKFPCITFEVVSESTRSVPRNVQDIILQLDIYVKSPVNTLIGKQLVENIYTTVNGLLNYYQDTDPLIVYMVQSLAIDNNEIDRQMWRKTLRYQIWVKNT
jgi:hypothetical protein